MAAAGKKIPQSVRAEHEKARNRYNSASDLNEQIVFNEKYCHVTD
jgi:hypothetical protein